LQIQQFGPNNNKNNKELPSPTILENLYWVKFVCDKSSDETIRKMLHSIGFDFPDSVEATTAITQTEWTIYKLMIQVKIIH
jgi:hypothetical protein